MDEYQARSDRVTNLPRAFSVQIDPLTASCEILGIDPPQIHEIGQDDLPEPYQTLLAHNRDMTSTLERYCGATLSLRIIEKHVENDRLTRQVVLETDTDRQSVEFGAIRIYLNRYTAQARHEIESCIRPLGTILERHNIEYVCSPSGFFSCPRNDFVARVFEHDEVDNLYGRCNTIMNEQGEPLAEVVEILAHLDGQDQRGDARPGESRWGR